jgi:CHAT domain-containing protein
VRRELDAAYLAHRDLVARAQREARREVPWVAPQLATLDAARAGLPEGTAFVLYHLTSSRAHAFLLERDGARGFDLGPAKEVVAAAEAFVRLVSTPDARDVRAARNLGALVLDPMAERLTRVRRLWVAPDGALAFVPFEALVESDGTRRLVERIDLAYVPSATVLSRLDARTEPGRGVVALGDPLYPEESPLAGGASPVVALRGSVRLERIPESGEEAREIAAFFPAEESTVLLRERASVHALAAALAARSGRLAALHVACHGYVDGERPPLSGLVLAGGAFVTADDVHRMRIPADLAVLSGCETGGGRLVAGEGVMGLVRAFFAAGCPRVVVSDWSVSDQSTRPFMRRFYESMRVRGLGPAAALAEAKRDALRAGGPTAHPYHWAAFVPWGRAD